ncbi:MAG: HAMP domain-containing histidine kinase [Flavobacteriaceae bacterium]|nr:HAMP domain-containing histidine kinase [Flavobacteriaceae bacterium]
MAKSEKNSERYIQELEEKIIDLSFKLKGKTKEIKVAEEATSKILGKLIHNLKNPVGVTFSFSEMMLEDLEDYSTEKLEKHLQIIKNSATFSLTLLDTISKYSRVQAPNFVLKSQNINYIELLSAILNEFKTQVSEKNIDLVVKFPTDELFLTLDEVEITEATRNILNNALRYSKENSTIAVTVTEHKNTVETEITDQGIGISETDLPNIFEEFYVVNTYSTDKQKCIGLGLTIAKKIVEYHKGKISAKSILERGSSFKISLPKS